MDSNSIYLQITLGNFSYSFIIHNLAFFESCELTNFRLQWIMYELGKNHQAQQRVREEALRIGGQEKRAPTFEDYPNMDYVHAVVMETLRLVS